MDDTDDEAPGIHRRSFAGQQRLRRDVDASSAGAAGQPAGVDTEVDATGWQDRGAYRLKAPSQQKLQEIRLIHRKDEAALKASRDRARQSIVQTGGKLGAPEHGSVGMQEARDKLLQQLTPAARRQQKQQQREEENRKREAERAAKEVERLKNLAERRRQQAMLDRTVNQAKAEAWQKRDADWRGGSGSSATAYGARSNDMADSDTLANETAATSVGSAMLDTECVLDTMFSEAATGPSGATVPIVQPDSTTFAEEAPAGSVVVSVPLQTCAVCDCHVSADALENVGGLGLCFGCASASRCLESATVPTVACADNVCQNWQCTVCTLFNTLTVTHCDACGNPRPRETAATANAAIGGLAPPSVSSGSQHKIQGAPSSQPQQQSFLLLSWLQRHQLQEYYGAMIENGFDDLPFLFELSAESLDEMLELIRASLGKKMKFKKLLLDPAKRQRSSQGQRECPVCLVGEQTGLDEVNVALVPCGHTFCAGHASDAMSGQSCPVCRSQPAATQRVYI